MPWRNSLLMDLRMQFISDYLRRLAPISELCHEYEISSKTAVDQFVFFVFVRGGFSFGLAALRTTKSH